MRVGLSVMFVAALVTVLASFQTPAAFAQEQQRDPNEGEPKHEINELQNRLHHAEDESKRNHLEGKIDALQELRQEAADEEPCEFPAQSVQLQRDVLIMYTSPRIVDVETDFCGNIIG